METNELYKCPGKASTPKDRNNSIYKAHIQERDLPPVPHDNPSSEKNVKDDRADDSIYEKLLAPNAPEDEDGYLIPVSLRDNTDPPALTDVDVILRGNPPAVPTESKRRLHKVRSDHTSLYGVPNQYQDNSPIDIDDLFSLDYSKNNPYGSSGNKYVSTSHLYQPRKTKPPPWKADKSRFMDDVDLDRPKHCSVKNKTRSEKNLHLDPNATERSHSLKKHLNAMDVFHWTDSFSDVRNVRQDMTALRYSAHPPKGYPEAPASLVYYSQRPEHISCHDVDPAYREYHRSMSVNGLCDRCGKYGDAFDIPIGSREEYGNTKGRYCICSEYGECDNDFFPPNNIRHLSVKEVAKCLRFIGMKERIVLRFSKEQIDGNLLCTLDYNLLKAGFPELNTLEIMKILHFIVGWRPKKI